MSTDSQPEPSQSSKWKQILLVAAVVVVALAALFKLACGQASCQPNRNHAWI